MSVEKLKHELAIIQYAKHYRVSISIDIDGRVEHQFNAINNPDMSNGKIIARRSFPNKAFAHFSKKVVLKMLDPFKEKDKKVLFYRTVGCEKAIIEVIKLLNS